MTSLLQVVLNNKRLQEDASKGDFGIERESLRVNEKGHIVETSHPSSFGSRDYHPYIQTDFAESQIEIITPTASSLDECLNWLNAITQIVEENLSDGELLWPVSMPYDLSNMESLKVAQLSSKDQQAYREHLEKRYGKARQLVSGVHLNFSFKNEFLAHLSQKTQINLKDLSHRLYMQVAKYYQRYEWLLIYLYAASPEAPDAYYQSCRMKAPNEKKVKALRMSSYGYVNRPSILLDEDHLEKYVRQLEDAVIEGKIAQEREYYSAIRLRGGDSARELLESGIRYIECRHIDNDPFSPNGVNRSQLLFLQALFVYLALSDPKDLTSLTREKASQWIEEVALSKASASLPRELYQEGERLLVDLLAFMEKMASFSPDSLREVKRNLEAIKDVSLTRPYRMTKELLNKEAIAALALKYKNFYRSQNFALLSFTDFELSTQALIKDAIQAGIAVEVLDARDQFISLSFKGHQEWVKNGNMTSLDTYISPLAMDNKLVTKKILSKASLRVPKGASYESFDEALANFNRYQGQSIVIKPKDTNFGQGIHMLENITDRSYYKAALKDAFTYSSQVLVEEWVKGIEYRFFVLNGRVEAVLRRDPAQVMGDGKSRIEELIDQKNQHPYRGKGHLAPLVSIEKGQEERDNLEKQGLTLKTVLAKGQVAYLRFNSNISTGGESVDVTDLAAKNLKDLASQAAKAMNAYVCGVDMIVQNLEDENSSYAIIECNYNPMMSMHLYPSQGKSRRLTRKILANLFPEYPDKW